MYMYILKIKENILSTLNALFESGDKRSYKLELDSLNA